jgi:hypothetical protein
MPSYGFIRGLPAACRATTNGHDDKYNRPEHILTANIANTQRKRQVIHIGMDVYHRIDINGSTTNVFKLCSICTNM